MGDTNQSQLPAWAWLITGVITGLFLAFLYYLAGIKVPEDSKPQPAASSGEVRKAPKFDFYTVLPDVEVMNKAPKSPSASTQSQATKTTPLANKHIIQTGSFQNVQDADRRRAELLLLGLNVKTEKVEVRPGQIFHRVQVGPFSDPKALADAQKTLDAHNIEHIVLTLKQ